MRYDARKQMLYLAPMAKNCRFPRRLRPFVRSLTPWISCPFKCARPLRKGQRKRERESGIRFSFLPSFFPFSPFLVHIMSPQLSPFIHTCARLALGEGGRKGGKDGPHIATPLLTTSSDLPICRARRELQGAVKRRSMPLGSAEEGDTRLIFGKEHVQFRLVIDPERGLQ